MGAVYVVLKHTVLLIEIKNNIDSIVLKNNKKQSRYYYNIINNITNVEK